MSIISQQDQLTMQIRKKTTSENIDNISRTVFYQHFFKRHPEIKWSFLASMVSRNAGWNMTDLRNVWFQTLLDESDRLHLFNVYESGNWTIFDDACPQLLLYEQSKIEGKPLFHLLANFNVSSFMIEEWLRFWHKRDEDRLCTALIINEQHVLQKAVIQTKLYQDLISQKLFYKMEQLTHFSYVVFPSDTGSLYTLYVRRFHLVAERIKLGRRLAYLLFHPSVYPYVYTFSRRHPHTGSRNDYATLTNWSPQVNSFPLRLVYPRIHHPYQKRADWYSHHTKIEQYFAPIKEWTPVARDHWIQQKWVAIYAAYKCKQLLNP
ncbi:DUF2515 family protein [Alkalicoccobacillus porphyridii]|uniref:DUF2515 domain-containing protein n=1 Tax=Alkalicoccobacillus porphyridii TaxID=2597270 RepID=A0A553ZZT6_9BACI|nr:DUF2515 family protein [Alkalicoccobacillus porphyridii]TSB46958.1 DUF2515 domain-containing protein [Alkalicoccobacillus porphyridii]